MTNLHWTREDVKNQVGYFKITCSAACFGDCYSIDVLLMCPDVPDTVHTWCVH